MFSINRGKWQGVFLCLILLGTALQAMAQPDQGAPPAIQWQNPPPSFESAPHPAISVPLPSTSSMRIIRFSELPDARERRQLEQQGVRLGNWLGDGAFFARLSPDAELSAEMQERVSAIHAIPNVVKIAPQLSSGIYQAHLRERIQTENNILPEKGALELALNVLFFDGYTDAETQVAVVLCGGRIVSRLESVNGAVVVLPEGSLELLASMEAVQWVEPVLPPLEPSLAESRSAIAAEPLYEAPYHLSGAGIRVMIYDQNAPYTAHKGFGKRILFHEDRDISAHHTHVAGIVLGNGAGSPSNHGVAPDAEGISFAFEVEGGLSPGFLYTNPGDMEADYKRAINDYGALISNNSISANVAANGFDPEWQGNYGMTSMLIDSIVRGSLGRRMRVVWSNGNERLVLGLGAYGSTPPPCGAKNSISVGAIFSDLETITFFTSYGPTDDGRIKPDLCAPGSQYGGDRGITSTGAGSPTDYVAFSGTSMAAPIVTGTGALILQEWFRMHPDSEAPWASTLKALLAHTAEDLGNRGPDYRHGYGLIQARAAIDQLRGGRVIQDSIDHNETRYYAVEVKGKIPSLRATLAWDDPPGTPNTTPQLVNDLDIMLLAPESGNHERHHPWTLFPGSPETPAVQSRPDRVNNMEQVEVANPVEGLWIVVVSGYSIPLGPQGFSLILPGGEAGGSTAVLQFDRKVYASGNIPSLVLASAQSDRTDARDSLNVRAFSDSEKLGEEFVLTETDSHSGIFQGRVPLARQDTDGALMVQDGDRIWARYFSANLTPAHQAEARIDWQEPALAEGPRVDSRLYSLRLSAQTNEEARVEFQLGTRPGETQRRFTSLPATDHAAEFLDLESNSVYYYRLIVQDSAGNTRLLNNDGRDWHAITKKEGTLLFTDDFDPEPLSGWETTGEPDRTEWVVERHSQASSQPNAYYFYTYWNPARPIDTRLITPVFQGGGSFGFQHLYRTDAYFDGCFLEISTDGGNTWTDLGPWIEKGRYTEGIYSITENPKAGHPAWTGRNRISGTTPVVVNLSEFPGPVRIAFRYATDDDFQLGHYWVIDNVWASAETPGDRLFMRAPESLDMSGPQGGPFDNAGALVTLVNTSEEKISWALDSSESWLTIGESGGSLEPRESRAISLYPGPEAETLEYRDSAYKAQVTLTDLESGTTRGLSVALRVLRPELRIQVQPDTILADATDEPELERTIRIGNGSVENAGPLELRLMSQSGRGDMITSDILGDALSSHTGGGIYRGNLYEAFDSSEVRRFGAWLDFQGSAELHYLVFESPTRLGLYRKVHDSHAQRTGSGPAFYDSDEIGLNLTPGHFYIMITGWQRSDIVFFSGDADALSSPSFGQYVQGHGLDRYPLEDDAIGAYSLYASSLFHQQIETRRPWLTIRPQEAKILPEQALDARLTIQTSGLAPGDYEGAIRIEHNAGENESIEIPVHLHIDPAGVFQIYHQPPDRAVESGQSVALRVGVSGEGPLRYQWYRDGEVLTAADHVSGLTSHTLRFDPLMLSDDGYYFVKVEGPESTLQSREARLRVIDMTPLPAPEWIDASDGSRTDRVAVRWSEVEGANFYRFYRSAGIDTPRIPVAGWINRLGYGDLDVKPGTVYYYWVRAAEDISGSRASDFGPYDTGFSAPYLHQTARFADALICRVVSSYREDSIAPAQNDAIEFTLGAWDYGWRKWINQIEGTGSASLEYIAPLDRWTGLPIYQSTIGRYGPIMYVYRSRMGQNNSNASPAPSGASSGEPDLAENSGPEFFVAPRFDIRQPVHVEATGGWFLGSWNYATNQWQSRTQGHGIDRPEYGVLPDQWHNVVLYDYEMGRWTEQVFIFSHRPR